jgi:segregation and condensation protein B
MEIKSAHFLKLSRPEQRRALETLLFAATEPVSIKMLFEILIYNESTPIPLDSAIENSENGNGSSPTEDESVKATSEPNENPFSGEFFFEKLIEEINDELAQTGRPYSIIRVAGGFQFATRSEYGQLLALLYKAANKRRLSQASLETLAVIAYRQPVTKPEIEQIRGISSGEIVNSLLDKGLVEIAGRKDSLGKPLLYKTTTEFLRVFGLNSLDELPRLRELEDISHNGEQAPLIEIDVKETIQSGMDFSGSQLLNLDSVDGVEENITTTDNDVVS